MKRKWKPWLYVAAVLLMSVSCEKKDPCDDGSCCGPPVQQLEFIQYVENAKVDVGSIGLIGIEGLDGEVMFCLLQEDFYSTKLKTSYDFRQGQPQPFKYRVWGKIYRCVNCPVLGVGMQVLYIQIDKIEKVN